MDDEIETSVVDSETIEEEYIIPSESKVSMAPQFTRPFHLENEALGGIVELFLSDSQANISSFLRKKVTIKFNSLTTCLFDEIDHDYSKLLMLSYHIAPFDQLGLITFDFVFLHAVINLLYGGSTKENETIMTSVGKSGLKIAKRVSEIFILALQDSMEELLRANFKLDNISNQLSTVFKRQKYDRCFNLLFNIAIDSRICNLNIVIPVKTIPSSEYNDLGEPQKMVEEARIEVKEEETIFDEKAKNELIDSTVPVSVNLPKITLKLKDVVTLKPGDIIPIGDPSLVNVSLNGKILFKASAGQSNSQKAIKILERV